MATTIPAGGRLIGEVLRGVVTAERLRKLAQAIPQEKTKEAECSDEKDETQCNQCKLQSGALLPPKPRRAIRKENKINWDYQLYIANMKAAPEYFYYCDKDTGVPLTNFDLSIAGRALSAIKGELQPTLSQFNIMEWLYEGVWFDGFWRSDCTVVDAKGRYTQFLDKDTGRPSEGFPEEVVFRDMVREANTHRNTILKAGPPAKLEWHFFEMAPYQWAARTLKPPLRVVYTSLPAIQA